MVKQKIFQKNLMFVIALLSLLAFQRSSLAAGGLIGSAPLYFRVQSGDDKELTLAMIKGKVAAIFYQNKDILDANKRLKDELNKLYYEQTGIVKDALVRLPIIDCSHAFWPFRGIWKRRLREYSKKEGVTIYCDWNGKVSSDYKMKADVSNVVIIDKSGRIRFFTSGEVKPEEINGVKGLLTALARE
ncbi:MAG: YtfJ family protein [Candidatus Binatia bacterium]|nr:YtfJ family protein [Candidatus Binatia bacterium]